MDAKEARRLRVAKVKAKKANKPVSTLPVRYGTQSLNSEEQTYYNNEGIKFKPILEYKPLTARYLPNSQFALVVLIQYSQKGLHWFLSGSAES